MNAPGLAARSASALAWSLVGAAGKVVAQFAIQVTLARLLEPRSFGQFAALLSVLALGATLADCGFGAALIQKKQLGEHDVRAALGWTLASATLIGGLLALGAPMLAAHFGDRALVAMFRLSGLMLVVQIAGSLSSNLLRRELRFKEQQLIHLTAYVLSFGVVGIALALAGFGGWSLVLAYALQTLLTVLANYSLARHSLRPRLGGSAGLIRFGLQALAVDLSGWGIDNIDRLLVGGFWGIAPLGLYTVAFNLSKSPAGLMLFAVQGVALSGAARLQDRPEAVRKGLLVALSALALATVPPFLLVACQADVVLQFVYSDKWLAATPYMCALAVAVPLIGLGTLTSAILRGTGRVPTEFRAQLVTAVVLVSGLVLLRHATLSSAVWVVPAAYLCRLLSLLAALRGQLALRAAELWSAARGATVLCTVGALLLALGGAHLPSASHPNASLLPMLGALLGMGACVLLRPSWLLGPVLAAHVCSHPSLAPLAQLIRRIDGGPAACR